ncbi:L-rhamnose mutarotase [Mucilaginibacter terrigena]|uniref:L-rhamnose mutarotase n=1 Tax=Mucilaginibacter terrigena TaxID=2492395 RepID=A0A4Q5LRX0_9SPHI|nr:L-rhamnose mutarotase [Mucilaginibacter terrigena]RYU92214.1 L-rhamnose mutarotase [Mucilaginibacter terrigena]
MKVFFIAIAVCLFAAGCTNPNASGPQRVQRYASITGLNPDSVQVYKDLHAHAWPAVLKKIKECNIRNYSIYIKQIDGKPYLFSYFEYSGTDFNADMKKMAADPNTQKWWRRTDPTQIPLPDAAAKGKIWSEMEEVFHTK